MFLLSKLLPWFVLPFGVSLILLLWGLARRRRDFMFAGVVVLLVGSNSFVGEYLIRSAENWAERRPVRETSVADAIVVLSSGRVVAPGKERITEWGDADRFFGGVELFHAGKAPLLIFTGAWISRGPNALVEGEILAEQAKARGVPADRISVTGKVLNTADEAKEVARVLRDRQLLNPRVLLVTAAFHMPRARQVFEQQGLAVDPFPVHFWLSQESELTGREFLPSVGALDQTQTALRELYGRAFYWLRDRF